MALQINDYLRYLIVIMCFIFSIFQVMRAKKQDKKGNIAEATNDLIYALISLIGVIIILEV